MRMFSRIEHNNRGEVIEGGVSLNFLSYFVQILYNLWLENSYIYLHFDWLKILGVKQSQYIIC